MLAELTSLLILPLLLSQGVISSGDKTTPYEDQEAYEVYSSILPSEWPLRVAHAKTLIIQSETKGYEMCLRPEKEWEEKVGPAISDYVRLNTKPLPLQRRINVEVQYQLIKAEELRSAIQTAGWEGFYQRYPNSGGWMELSAVGFNANKTVAVVYMGHHCGMLCGGGGFHVLEKKDGQWVALDWKGSSCAWAS
ncbi:MAG TPA: hypothetical protein VGQ39_06240 [Pyrinomonadaceae bacterium]|jgi:hypothetical protein|nr:hypothetical protein [Pyrinomonadaceae bacterium]